MSSFFRFFSSQIRRSLKNSQGKNIRTCELSAPKAPQIEIITETYFAISTFGEIN